MLLAVEGMILLSKIIKFNYTQTNDENKRVITLRPLLYGSNSFEDDSPTPRNKIERIDLSEIEAQAEMIKKNAKEQAASIVQQAENQFNEIMHQIEVEKKNWHAEKEHWIEMAKQEGYSEGFDLGKQEGFKEYKTIIDEAHKIVELSKIDYQKNIEQSEMTILNLAVKTAEKIMGYTLDLNPNVFLNLVKRVIKEVKAHQDIQINVHPMYYDLILSQKEEIKTLFNSPVTELYINPDDELEPTNCILESSFGRIDASIDSQLNELKTKLLQILEGEMKDESS